MTNLEAIRVNISDAHGVILTEGHFVKALTDNGVDSAGIYSAAEKTNIDKATLACYDMILGSANLTEGSLSYNINIEAVKAARQKLADSLGVRRRNVVRGVSPW
jgi:hypothetical protein